MIANWTDIDNSLEYFTLDRRAQLVHVYSGSLKNVKQQMVQLYEKHDKLSYAEMIKYNRMQEMEKQLGKELKVLGKSVKSITRESIKTGLEDSYYKTGFYFENHTGLNLGFTRLPTEQIKATLDDPFDWAKKVTHSVSKLQGNLKDVMVKGFIQGISYPQMAAELSKRMKMGASETMKILRTEVHRAQVRGRLKGITKTEGAAERLDVETVRIWQSAKDDRTRTSHVQMNGKPANNKNMFRMPSGLLTEGPSLTGDPGEDINCRCSVRMEFKGYEPDLEASEGMFAGQGFSCLEKNVA